MKCGEEENPAALSSAGLVCPSSPPNRSKHPADAVVAAVERGRVLRLPVGAVGDGDVDQRVEAVVPQDLRIGHGDHVDPEEHPGEVLVDVVVDRPGGLRRGAGEVQVHLLPGAGQRQLQLVRAVAHAVVADVVGEGERPALLEDHLQQHLHRVVVALQQGVQRGQVGRRPEPLAHLSHPA
jgi:hypothetical protein